MSSDPNPKRYEEVVACWLPEDRGAVHVKVVTLPHYDPVELSADQAREFAAKLLKLADDLSEESHHA
jgi:hypothetical protein